jgi:hypothetical protein
VSGLLAYYASGAAPLLRTVSVHTHMACTISFKEERVHLNNMQFARLVDFGIEVAEGTAGTEERQFVDHMRKMRDESFFPGRGIWIEQDFPSIEEQKFWSRVFFDVSRAIFDHRVGIHDHSYWQAQAIHQAHGTGLIFEQAVRSVEPRWSADTHDRREFDKYVNRIER